MQIQLLRQQFLLLNDSDRKIRVAHLEGASETGIGQGKWSYDQRIYFPPLNKYFLLTFGLNGITIQI